MNHASSKAANETSTREAERLATLHSYRLLDTDAEACFDRLVQMAAETCDAPIAMVSLIDAGRQWFKARVGTETVQTPRDISFCTHVVADPSQVLVVPDATLDPRFKDSPLVVGPGGVRFYAGVPLIVENGHTLGALCVNDYAPRGLTLKQSVALKALGRAVVKFLERRRRHFLDN